MPETTVNKNRNSLGIKGEVRFPEYFTNVYPPARDSRFDEPRPYPPFGRRIACATNRGHNFRPLALCEYVHHRNTLVFPHSAGQKKAFQTSTRVSPLGLTVHESRTPLSPARVSILAGSRTAFHRNRATRVARAQHWGPCDRHVANLRPLRVGQFEQSPRPASSPMRQAPRSQSAAECGS